jgi:hypothetical protein
MSANTVEAISRDRAFISDPEQWPKWPVLPLIRRNRAPWTEKACGFILPGQLASPVVYIGVIYMLDTIAEQIKQETGKTYVDWEEIVARLEKVTYDSLDALVAEWKVD